MSAPLLVAFGGGVNSTAMLCEMARRRIHADAILFADTGGERPATYRHIVQFSEWLAAHGQPPITVVHKGGRPETLEENCLRSRMLPSLAYGYKGCSHKYKIEPQEAWTNRHYREHFRAGGQITKAIGYGADETRRARIATDAKYRYWYPLIEWDMDREECLEVIEASDAPMPGKSACFFCPASTKPEILDLRARHPDLYSRALAMEDNAADLRTVKGLGRKFSWRDVASAPSGRVDVPCGCYDGEAAE